MKTNRHLLPLLALAGLLCTAPQRALAADKKNDSTAPAAAKGTLVKVTDKDAAWAAQARKTYPLQVCLSSDEKLGSMGETANYIYREKGKPDRLVVFCCEGCEEDFTKDPAKHLAKLDAAAKAKSGAPKK
ncbi:MAG TPA: hypothetical protein VM029_04200 [Opitutaceae bacterium]|nr:hypothetical protein [Opitutaceae bacterium]